MVSVIAAAISLPLDIIFADFDVALKTESFINSSKKRSPGFGPRRTAKVTSIGKWTLWYKNGQIKSKVNYKDGKIGLFDTKAGITAETAVSRAKGLARYIKKQNKNGKNLFGGIVIEKEESFWINSNEEYQYDENDLLNIALPSRS